MLLLLLFAFTTKAQQKKLISKKSYSFEFQVFADFFCHLPSSYSGKTDYHIKRTLAVYRQQISPSLDLCLAGDTYVKGNNGPFDLCPYLKRAFIKYQTKGLEVSAGLLVLEQFKYQREIWDLRYLDKTFRNKFKYGDNRGVGILLKHDLNDRLSFDIALTSGYNTPLDHYSENFSLMSGQTLTTRLGSFRLFNCISIKPYFSHMISLFITKQIQRAAFGMEIANYYSNNKELDEDKYGFSIFGKYPLFEIIDFFLRCDINCVSAAPGLDKISWLGLQYSFNKFLKASAFYRNENKKGNYLGLAVYFYNVF